MILQRLNKIEKALNKGGEKKVKIIESNAQPTPEDLANENLILIKCSLEGIRKYNLI
jgi:hypothetical protein